MGAAQARYVRRFRDRGRGRLGGNAPARDRRVGADEIGLAVAGAAEQQGGDARGLGGELQPARSGQADPAGELGDDAGETAMTQPVLHDEERLAAAGLGVDDTVRMQAGGGEARGEDVALLDHPEHLAVDAREDAGGEHGGGSAVLDVGAGAGDLVQRAAGKAAAGQSGVEVGHAEGKWRRGIGRGAMTLQASDEVAQIAEGHRRAGEGANGVHGVVRTLFSYAGAVKLVSF